MTVVQLRGNLGRKDLEMSSLLPLHMHVNAANARKKLPFREVSVFWNTRWLLSHFQVKVHLSSHSCAL